MLFPKVRNIKEIVIEEHPTFSFSSKRYIDYWREQKKRCIEGFWYNETPDGAPEYRFCPPQLYFYINLGTIIVTDHAKKTRLKRRPLLRDVEWIIFCTYLVARGFSGFKDDTEFTCNNAVKNNGVLTENCYNGKELKKYVDPYEYLKQTHKSILGIPLYENESKNMFLLGSRGLGKSYSLAHIILQELLFDGAKEYNVDTIHQPNKVDIFVGAFKADKSSELLSKVEDAINNLPGSFGSGTSYIPSPFYKEMSGTLKVGNTKSPFEHKYKKKENGSWNVSGTGSKILHEIFTVENPQAAAGSRPTLIVVEEVGLLPNVKAVHGANSACQITEGIKFGTSAYIGTGGNMEKIVESESIFRHPDEYDMISFDDIWENTGKIGLFIPVQYTYTDLKDKDGNTIFELANKRVEERRKDKKWDRLQHEKMNYPIVPSEMFLSSKGSIFPQDEIQKQIKYVIKNDRIINANTNYGTLVYDSEATNGVAFKQDTNNEFTPITEYPLKPGSDLKGAVVIYEHPPEVIPSGLYKVVYDPVRDDNILEMSKGVSLAAIYVYKAVQKFDGVYDQIVAHFVGRMQNTDDIHEMALKLAQYYNTRVFPEMNLPGFYKYAIHTKKMHMLEPTPVLSLGKIQPDKKQRYNVGIYMNETLIIQAEQYLNRWLLQVRDVDRDELGNIIREKRNIDFIYDKALLEELLSYNRTINTDRVSALLLLMYLIEESKELPQITATDTNNTYAMLDYLTNTLSVRHNTKTFKTNEIKFPTLYG